MAVHRGNSSCLTCYIRRAASSHWNVRTNRSKQLFNSYNFSLPYSDRYPPWPRSKVVTLLSSHSKSPPLSMAKMPTQGTTTLTCKGMEKRGKKSTPCRVTSSRSFLQVFAFQYFSSRWTRPSSPLYRTLFSTRGSLHLLT